MTEIYEGTSEIRDVLFLIRDELRKIAFVNLVMQFRIIGVTDPIKGAEELMQKVQRSYELNEVDY